MPNIVPWEQGRQVPWPTQASVNPGKRRRLGRLGPGDGRYLFVPMDHSVSDGPIASVEAFRSIVADVAAAGADAIVVHKGRAAVIADVPLGSCSLVVHLSASTSYAPDVNEKVLVGTVEDAVRLGADAVSIHVNFGTPTEAAQLTDFGVIASACERYGMPLLAMVYARGEGIADPYDPAVLRHITNVAVDLGANIVKTSTPRPISRMSEIAEACPASLVFSGGPRSEHDDSSLARLAEEVVASGASGLAIGRRVWTHPEPASVVRTLVDVLHPSAGEGRIPAARTSGE
ncbi:2-amino-3,7-dideoxy-D-threo-hept-6-ulosonate synthase [Krasilnikovia sp. M28-CT-15]